MIIYHAITTYHLIEAWTHKALMFSSEPAILLYDDVMEEKFPNMKSLLSFNVFTRIIGIPYRKSPRNVDALDEWMDNVFSELEISINDDIYVFGGQFYFSYWLIKNHIPFIFGEEASGRLSKPEVVMENDMALNMLRYTIAFENGMYTGQNVLVKGKIYNSKAQNEGFIDDKAVDFDVAEKIAYLPKETIEDMMSFFNTPRNIKVDHNSVILLTQHFTNLRMMTLDDQIALYMQTLDYYLDSYYPVIKVHPDDQVFYGKLIKKGIVIRERFPSELLPYVFEEMPSKIATISSTGIFSFLSIFREHLYFDTDYEKNYKKNHVFYFIGYLLKLLNVQFDRVAYYGESKRQLINMLIHSNLNISNKFTEQINTYTDRADIIILDKDENIEINPEKIYFFTDVSKMIKTCLWLKANIGKLVTKKVYIYRRKELISSESLIIYAPDDQKRKRINEMKYVKKLENSDLEILVPDQDELTNRVNVLEAILEATEKRLREEINSNENKETNNV